MSINRRISSSSDQLNQPINKSVSTSSSSSSSIGNSQHRAVEHVILSTDEATNNNWVKAQDPENPNRFYYYHLSSPKNTTTWIPPVVFRYESMIACQLYDIVENHDIRGGDIGSKQATDLVSCCQACEHTPNCYSFVFSIDKCFMKNSKAQAGTGKRKNFATSGHYNPVRTKKVNAGRMALPRNFNRSSSSLPLPLRHTTTWVSVSTTTKKETEKLHDAKGLFVQTYKLATGGHPLGALV